MTNGDPMPAHQQRPHLATRSLLTVLCGLHHFQRSAKDVGDLLRYEDQITSRTSELQSLKRPRDYLLRALARRGVTSSPTRREKA